MSKPARRFRLARTHLDLTPFQRARKRAPDDAFHGPRLRQLPRAAPAVLGILTCLAGTPAPCRAQAPRLDSVSPPDVLPDEPTSVTLAGDFGPSTTASVEGVGEVENLAQDPAWNGSLMVGLIPPLPAGVSPGYKAITVSDAGGSYRLENAVLYVDYGASYVISCFPWEVAPEGGTIVQLEGRRFQAGQVPAFRPADSDLELYPCPDVLETLPNRITFRLPPIPVRPVGDYYTSVLLDGPSGNIVARRAGLLSVFDGTLPPVLTGVEPGEVDARGGTIVEIHGERLRSYATFAIGPVVIPLSEAVSDEVVRGIVPPLSPNSPGEAYDAVVIDGRGLFTLPGAVRAVDRIRSVAPSVVAAGSSVVLSFEGFDFEDRFRMQVGSAPLEGQVYVDSSHMQGTLAADAVSLPPGVYPAYLLDEEGGVAGYLPGAVTVLDGTHSPHIVSVSPGQVSTRGGDVLTVAVDSPPGRVAVLVGGKTLVNLDDSSPQILRGEAPPLDAGLHAVEIVSTDGVVLDTAPDAVEAVDPQGITITSVIPFEVATAGGTPVELTGTGFELGFAPRLGGFSLTGVQIIDGEHLRGFSPELSEGPHAATLDEEGTPLARLDDAVLAVPIAAGVPVFVSRPQSNRFLGGVDTLSISVAGVPSGAVLRVGETGVLPSGIPTEPCQIGAGQGGGGGGAAETVDGTLEGIVPELPPGVYRVDLYLPGKGIIKVLDDAVEIAGRDAPPLVSHVVSTEVARDGSTRLYIFGSGFGPDTQLRIAGKPLLQPDLISSRLVIAFAPPLDEAEAGGLKTLEIFDPRGDSSTSAAVEYVEPTGDGARFVRGDSNDSGRVDISDAVTTLGYLFLGSPQSLGCAASADVDANAKIDISDPIQLLQHLFLGGPAPAPPYPGCGAGDAASPLGCAAFRACGFGGGGAIAGSLKPNVFVLSETRAAAGDPILVDLSAAAGQVVIDDPPGGLDLKTGDIIAGYVPPTSASIYEGVTYVLKLESVVGSSCLSKATTDSVFGARAAALTEVFQGANVQVKMPEARGNLQLAQELTKVDGRTNCDFNDAGGGAGEDGGKGAGGGLLDPLVDLTISGLPIIQWQDGANYVDAGFNRLRLKFAASEASLGLSISDDGVDGLTFFSGLLLDAEFLFYIDAQLQQRIQAEKKLLRLRKDILVLVLGIPIHFAMTGDLYAGLDIDDREEFHCDSGAKASFKAGIGLEVVDGRLRNVSGFDPPAVEPLDHQTPDLQGRSIRATMYVKPEVHFFAGILFRGLTADLGLRSKNYTRFHADGTFGTYPCIQWGIDAGLETTINPEIQLFGRDLFDETIEVLRYDTPDVYSGEIGCHFRPVAKVSYTIVKLPGDRFEVHLDASGSFDPDGGPLYYRWDFDEDNRCDYASADPRVTYYSDRACPFSEQTELFSVCGRGRLITLKVTDDEGSSAIQTIKVILE